MNNPIPPELIEDARRRRRAPQPQISIEPPPEELPPIVPASDEPPRAIEPYLRRGERQWYDLDD